MKAHMNKFGNKARDEGGFTILMRPPPLLIKPEPQTGCLHSLGHCVPIKGVDGGISRFNN